MNTFIYFKGVTVPISNSYQFCCVIPVELKCSNFFPHKYCADEQKKPAKIFPEWK